MYANSPAESYSTRRSHTNSMSGSTNGRLQHCRPLPCRFHPSKQLHTFCLSKECMLPMCSACITIHNQDHLEAKTHGDYQDITHLLKSALEAIQDQQLCLEELSREYVADYEQKASREDTCRALVAKARSRAHQELDRAFDKLMIGLEERISIYTENLQLKYEALEESIHSNYKLLAKQKEDLSRVYMQSGFGGDQSSVNMSQTIREGQPFTSSLGFGSSRHKDDQTRQQQKQILKAMIHFYRSNFDEANGRKIEQIRRHISELKLLDFSMGFNFQRMRHLLNAITSEAIQVKQANGTKGESRRQEKDVKRKQAPAYDSSYEINQIMKQTHERLKKMQLSSNNDGLTRGDSRV